MRLALAISSAVVLVVHGTVFYDQYFHEWERLQSGYFDQAAALATNDTERAELGSRRSRIEQITVTQFGDARVDRCTTCHIAVDDPRFVDHFEPLKTHPYVASLGDTVDGSRRVRRHKFSDFGCSVCHDGQGRGLETFYSHGADPFWPRPMLGHVTQASWNPEYRPQLLGPQFLEANCAQCHTESDFPGTPHVNEGRRLFFAKGCFGCHRIEGLSDGTLGPDLSEVGRDFKIDYLWESIVSPRANSPTSFMPKFRLTDAEVTSLVVFLKSRAGRNFTETSLERYRARLSGEAAPEGLIAPVGTEATTPATEDAAIARGGQLVQERACLSCHRLGDTDGGIAPDLSFAGLMRDRPWLLGHVRNPRALVPDSIMPAFRLSDADFGAMASYLASLRPPPVRRSAADNYQVLCARCHGDKGQGDGVTALYLDPAPRDLSKSAFMTTKPVGRLVDAVLNGVPGTSMPPWGRVLDETSAREVVDYVLETFVSTPARTFREPNVPDINPVGSSAESVARGERTYLQRCTGCHGRKADGKGPNSADMLPRPRNLRNSPFVANLSDRRLLGSILYGVQGTAMQPWLDYGLSVSDAGDLINYIHSLSKGT